MTVIILISLIGCSKKDSKIDESKNPSISVQVIDEKLKPFIGKWGHNILGDCSTSGTLINSETITISGEKPEKTTLPDKDGRISIMSGATAIGLSDDKSHLIYWNSDGITSDFRKCIFGKFKVVKTDEKNRDYSLTVFVDSEDGATKNLELSLSAEKKPEVHQFVKSNLGKILTIEYETIIDEDAKSKTNLITSIK
jgi:hypothetical protein